MKYPGNGTVTEIILSGFPNLQHYSSILFTVLLVIYLFIITGNILICFVVQKEPSLHSPMYLFIGVLSLTELCYTGVTIPTMLSNLLDEKKKVSFNGCLLQAYFLHSLGAAECYLLTTMAYDRYLAICKPLHYSSIMTVRLFIKLAATCIISGFLSPVIETVLISSLPFCGPSCIQTLFCDFPPLIALACTDTKLYILAEFMVSCLIILLSCSFVLQSYCRIIHVILRIKSRKGRQKTFSTCAAHLVIVILFFGSISFMYIRLSESYSVDFDRTVGLTYAVFTPLANPVIYGLRNKEIKKSLHKQLHFIIIPFSVYKWL